MSDTSENMPTKPGWYPVTVVNSKTGKTTRAVVEVTITGSTLGGGYCTRSPGPDSYFTEWGPNIDDALARLAELEAERRDVDTILDNVLEERSMQTHEDRTDPAPGWEWCCMQEHTHRYLVNGAGPVKGNGSRRIADTIEETWLAHDADRIPDLKAENASLRAVVERLTRRPDVVTFVEHAHVWRHSEDARREFFRSGLAARFRRHTETAEALATFGGWCDAQILTAARGERTLP